MDQISCGLKISDVRLPKGAHHRPKRIGLGIGSGHGKTAGRGTKGQRSRAGGRVPPWFEGGQMPLIRRLPKRGFTNRFKRRYQVINVGQLKELAFEEITPEVLLKIGFIERANLPVKILGKGDLGKSLFIKAHGFSAVALQKIQKAGGKTELIGAK